MKRLLSLILCVLFVFPLASCKKPNDAAPGADVTQNTVVKCDSTGITVAMMTYWFNEIFQQVVSTYESQLSSIGLDPSKPLTEQHYKKSDTESVTWYDYIMDSVKQKATSYALLYSAAKKNGFTLTQAEQNYIDDHIKQIENEASQNEMRTDAFIKTLYGDCVTVDIIRQCDEMYLYSQSYKNYLTAQPEYTDADYEAYYGEHSAEYIKINYAYCTFKSEDTNRETARAKADELAAIKTEEEFVQYIRSYLETDVYGDPEAVVDFDSILDEHLVRGAVFEDTAFMDWAFDDARVPYEVYTDYDHSAGNYSVYMIFAASENSLGDDVKYREESLAKNMRIISLGRQSFASVAEMKAKAQSILSEFESGDKTPESFSALANKYSSALYKDGVVKNSLKGDTGSDTLDEWLYAPQRTTGETTRIDTEYGTIITYFDGDGIAKWKAQVDNTLRTTAYDTKYEELKTLYPVTVDNQAAAEVKQVPMLSPDAASTTA